MISYFLHRAWINTRALVCLSLCSAAACAKEIVIFVAPDGNDAWSGRLATAASGGKDGPVATLPAALTSARRARATAKADDDIAIRLRAGTYELQSPMELAPADSGSSAEHPFTIEGAAGQRPVISGGRRITGWARVPGSEHLWRAKLPGVTDGKWVFHQLFVNGKRMTRARTPNEGSFFRIIGAGPAGTGPKFRFKHGDIQPVWANSGDVEVIALLAWSDLRMPIRAVDDANDMVTLAGEPAPSNRENDARYYIENAPDALDSPGEWLLDSKTGVITLWPEAGVSPDSAEVIAPALTELVHIQGDPQTGKAAQFIRFRGLTFSHTDWTLGERGYTGTQAAVNIHGALRAEFATSCTVEDCQFSELGGYALEFGRGCKQARIASNELRDLGAGGIRIGEPAGRTEEFDLNYGNIVTDNRIHRLGRVYADGIGVIVFQSGRNLIAHNEIYDTYYTAISVGWNWGYRETPCHDNIIEYNHLHDIGQNMLSDMGAVYTLGPQRGTIIRNNLIHDVNSFTYGGWGLYTDEGSSDIVLENNVVYRTKSAGFHQHYGRDNIVRNNIFAFGREHQLMRTRDEDHVSFIFERNIVYYDSGDLLGSNWKGDESRFKLSKNLYFDARPGGHTVFAGSTFEQWQAKGHDAGSIMADPMFKNPSAYDFRIEPGSPALKLGFSPIDLSTVGVRPRLVARHQ